MHMDGHEHTVKTAILIVDDESAVWQLYNRTLAGEGYDCHWASSAGEAREMLSRRSFDLVLCDIVMPGGSGFDLCRHINTAYPDLPVIIVTGLGGMETAREALTMDIYGYIVKPVDRGQVLISVANALKRKALETRQRRYHQNLEEEAHDRKKELVWSHEALKSKEVLIAKKADELEALNNALKVLLKKQQEDRAVLEEQMQANVFKTIKPYLEKLKACRLSNRQLRYVEMIEAGIDQIVSPFAKNYSTASLYLTPSEFQVADLIRHGKSTKEIAALLNLSENTIISHRYKIRTKLGLKNSKQNLRAYLNTRLN